MLSVLRPPEEQLVIRRVGPDEQSVGGPVEVVDAGRVAQESDRLLDVSVVVEVGDVDDVVARADRHLVAVRRNLDDVDPVERDLVLLNGALVVDVLALKRRRLVINYKTGLFSSLVLDYSRYTNI